MEQRQADRSGRWKVALMARWKACSLAAATGICWAGYLADPTDEHLAARWELTMGQRMVARLAESRAGRRAPQRDGKMAVQREQK